MHFHLIKSAATYKSVIVAEVAGNRNRLAAAVLQHSADGPIRDGKVDPLVMAPLGQRVVGRHHHPMRPRDAGQLLVGIAVENVVDKPAAGVGFGAQL